MNISRGPFFVRLRLHKRSHKFPPTAFARASPLLERFPEGGYALSGRLSATDVPIAGNE